MPTKKPVIQVVLEENYKQKLEAIAEKEERSISKQAAKIIKEYINNYEKTSGTISIGNIANVGENNGTINM